MCSMWVLAEGPSVSGFVPEGVYPDGAYGAIGAYGWIGLLYLYGFEGSMYLLSILSRYCLELQNMRYRSAQQAHNNAAVTINMV